MTGGKDSHKSNRSDTTKLYIDGRWVEPSSSGSFEVRNPATNEVVAHAADGSRSDAHSAISAAARAFPDWSTRTAEDRSAILHEVARRILAERERLGRLIATEEGKPIVEAIGEVGYAAAFLQFFADESQRVRTEELSPTVPGKRMWTIQQPVGVAAIVSIWNFPAAGITRPLGAALAAGCTAVVKPSERTPLTAAAIFEVFDAAGLPAGAANLVTALDPRPIGAEFVSNPFVRKISFTGSVEVGREIMRGAADQIQRVSLELGGHAPLIVFEDADLDAAVEGAVASKFRNNGQTCICLNRIYVQNSVRARFTELFVDRVRQLKLGDPLDDTVQVGPLIDSSAITKVKAHVEDAVEKGARILLGGHVRTDKPFDRGFFFEPTVLAEVPPNARIMREETFGPVAPIVAFESEDEVLAAANALPYGLAAFVYTRDTCRARRVADRLEYGIVGLNDSLPGAPHVPFGGVKQSGLGKEGGRLGLEEFLETKLISEKD